MDQLAVAEADVDRLVDHAFAPQPLVQAELAHQIDGALLQHAGAHAVFHIGAAARFQHDAVDALAIEQMREEQARGARADDDDLRVHFLSRTAFFSGIPSRISRIKRNARGTIPGARSTT